LFLARLSGGTRVCRDGLVVRLVKGKRVLARARLFEGRLRLAENAVAQLRQQVERLEQRLPPPDETLFDFLTRPGTVAGHHQGDD